jgi:four helix bundle protein
MTEKLEVVNKTENLVIEIYGIIKKLPSEEKYNLSDQMRRASLSIPSCIAEGNERFGYDRVQLLRTALGSLRELVTQLNITQKLYDIDCKHIIAEYEHSSGMIHKLLQFALASAPAHGREEDV